MHGSAKYSVHRLFLGEDYVAENNKNIVISEQDSRKLLKRLEGDFRHNFVSGQFFYISYEDAHRKSKYFYMTYGDYL